MPVNQVVIVVKSMKNLLNYLGRHKRFLLVIVGIVSLNFAYGQNGGHAFTEVNIGNTEVEEYISARYKSVYDNSGIWTRTDKDVILGKSMKVE